MEEVEEGLEGMISYLRDMEGILGWSLIWEAEESMSLQVNRLGKALGEGSLIRYG